MFMTGYYGVPGSSQGNFTVHVINEKALPICGWKPRSEMKFQWCARGIVREYIECEHCRQRANIILAAAKLK